MNGMLAGIAAVISNVVIDMGTPFFKNRDIFSIIIIAAVFIAVYFFKINILWIIIICAVLGIIKGTVGLKDGEKR